MKEPSQLRYNLQHDTHCKKSLISRSKFMSLYVLKVFILTDQISYPSNTDFPNFPKLNCSVNGQDTGLSADRSPHNVLVMAELILRDRDMADLWEQGSSLVLQVWLLGFISSSATPFTEDFWICSPLFCWDKGIVLLSLTCQIAPVRGKVVKVTKPHQVQEYLTPGLALPPYRVHALSWR